MLKEYAVYYTLTSANGFPVPSGIIVKTLKEVDDVKRRIKAAGYEFNGVQWRERTNSRNRLREIHDGWMAV